MNEMVLRWGEAIIFLITTLGKSLEMRVDLNISQHITWPNGFETSSLNFATSIQEVLVRWILRWKHYASTGNIC